MEEIWKTVTVNSDYDVSNLGRVRSNKKQGMRVLKPFYRGSVKKDCQGARYFAVKLLKNGRGKDYAIHRLVAMAFIPNPNNLPQVNHKNGIKYDNRVDNLEWCDNSYNIWHSYNILGNNSGVSKEVVQYTKDGSFVKRWESALKAERETGIDSSSITCVCKKKGIRKTAGGFVWRYADDADVINDKKNTVCLRAKYDKITSVVQISKYGEKIKVFDSVKEASTEVGICDGGISGVCMKRNRGYNYAGGFIWRYESDFNENEFGYFVNKTFVQMTKKNIFVAEYKGTHELVDKGGFELVKVIMCCREKRNSTNGFKWCIKEEGLKARATRRERSVVKFDKQMNFISEYPSATIAARENNTHSTHILECCMQGKHRSAGGFRWMYKEDYDKVLEKTITTKINEQA